MNFKFFATEYTIYLDSPFLQLERKKKMAVGYFIRGDHFAEVLLSGTPLLEV